MFGHTVMLVIREELFAGLFLFFALLLCLDFGDPGFDEIGVDGVDAYLLVCEPPVVSPLKLEIVAIVLVILFSVMALRGVGFLFAFFSILVAVDIDTLSALQDFGNPPLVFQIEGHHVDLLFESAVRLPVKVMLSHFAFTHAFSFSFSATTGATFSLLHLTY